MKPAIILSAILTLIFISNDVNIMAQGSCDCCNYILSDYANSYEFLFQPTNVKTEKIKTIQFSYREKENDSSKLLSVIHFNRKGFVTKTLQYHYANYVTEQTIKRNRAQKIISIIEIYSDSNGVIKSPESMTNISEYSYDKDNYNIRHYFWVEKDGKYYSESHYDLDSIGRVTQTSYSSQQQLFPDNSTSKTTYTYSKDNYSMIEQSYYNDSLNMVTINTYNDQKLPIRHLSSVVTEDGTKRVQTTIDYDTNNQVIKIRTEPLDSVAFTECPDQSDNTITFYYKENLISEIHYEYIDHVYKFIDQHYRIYCNYIFRNNHRNKYRHSEE